MKKLSSIQVEVLRALAEPDIKADHILDMGWFRPNPYWRISSGPPIRKGTIEKLIELKLFNRVQKNWEDAVAIITQAGRDYLAKIDKEDK